MKNVCYNLKAQQFEISKDGRRQDFDDTKTQYFILNSYRENNHPDSVVSHDPVTHFKQSTYPLRILCIGNPTLLFKRFVGSNIMHSFHDNWLPALMTIVDTEELRDLDEGQSRFLIGFDNNGPYYSEIYSWLGKYYQIDDFVNVLAHNSADLNNLTHICFENAVMGLSTSAQWYQYGFKQHEGPVLDLNKDFAGENVRAAIDWLKDNLNLPKVSKKKYVSIISRKSTRLILNEDELKTTLQESFPQYEVILIGEETMKLTELISTIHETAVMIGMHGALLILSAFLPTGATLIEMFFFGVDPHNYTPYKTLASLTGMDITYRTWSNPNEEAPHNYAHEERGYTMGGIKHLPASIQNGVKATKMTPKHRCCYNPLWTYRLFQDTRVNITEIISIIQSIQ